MLKYNRISLQKIFGFPTGLVCCLSWVEKKTKKKHEMRKFKIKQTKLTLEEIFSGKHIKQQEEQFSTNWDAHKAV